MFANPPVPKKQGKRENWSSWELICCKNAKRLEKSCIWRSCKKWIGRRSYSDNKGKNWGKKVCWLSIKLNPTQQSPIDESAMNVVDPELLCHADQLRWRDSLGGFGTQNANPPARAANKLSDINRVWLNHIKSVQIGLTKHCQLLKNCESHVIVRSADWKHRVLAPLAEDDPLFVRM